MLRLSPGGSRLGRSADNTIQLPDASISRYHAFLGDDDEGQVRLTDLGSTNGTFLNGRRLPENTPVRVQDGDRLQFGANVIVKFIRPDPCEEQFQREMFERTVRDPLTGLYNRAFFLAQFGPLADRGALRGLGTAVLMLDIDHFKRINDTHGHEVGDAVLREVAGVLRQATRADDLVARYGGEEFVVALPVAAPDQATERAERVRSTLASRRILAGGVPLAGHRQPRPGVHPAGPAPVGRRPDRHGRPGALPGQERRPRPDRLQPRRRQPAQPSRPRPSTANNSRRPTGRGRRLSSGASRPSRLRIPTPTRRCRRVPALDRPTLPP